MDREIMKVKSALENIGFEANVLLPVGANILEELKRYQELLQQKKIVDYAVIPSSTGGGGHEIFIKYR